MRNLVLTDEDDKIMAIIQTSNDLEIGKKTIQAIKDDGSYKEVELTDSINYKSKGDYHIIKALCTDEDDEEYENVYYLTEVLIY